MACGDNSKAARTGPRSEPGCGNRVAALPDAARSQGLAGASLLLILALSLAACSSQPEDRGAGAPHRTPSPRPAIPREQMAPPPQPTQDAAARALSAARSKSREEQRELIRDLILDGVFANIELQEGVPRVYVRPAFYLLTFVDQQSYMAVVYAFAYPEGAGDRVIVVDDVSGVEKGVFTEAGLQLAGK